MIRRVSSGLACTAEDTGAAVVRGDVERVEASRGCLPMWRQWQRAANPDGGQKGRTRLKRSQRQLHGWHGACSSSYRAPSTQRNASCLRNPSGARVEDIENMLKDVSATPKARHGLIGLDGLSQLAARVVMAILLFSVVSSSLSLSIPQATVSTSTPPAQTLAPMLEKAWLWVLPEQDFEAMHSPRED